MAYLKKMKSMISNQMSHMITTHLVHLSLHSLTQINIMESTFWELRSHYLGTPT